MSKPLALCLWTRCSFCTRLKSLMLKSKSRCKFSHQITLFHGSVLSPSRVTGVRRLDMWTPVTCPVTHYDLVILYVELLNKHTYYTDCTSAEPYLGHVTSLLSVIQWKHGGIVLVLRIVGQLLSSIWSHPEQLNETLLPREQWGVKSLASMAMLGKALSYGHTRTTQTDCKMPRYVLLSTYIRNSVSPSTAEVMSTGVSVVHMAPATMSPCHWTNSIWQVFLQQIDLLNYLVSRKIFSGVVISAEG